MIDDWFKKVEAFLKEINLSPDISSRLWNTDETGFCTSAASSLVLARKGSRNVHETSGGRGREFFTVLATGAADGTRLPPFILYKGKNLYARWTKDGPAGAVYGVNESGWMEGRNFVQWFEKQFVPAVASLLTTGPVVLFVDGHHSHLTLELIQVARSSVYGPVKKTWKAILKDQRLKTVAEYVIKEEFPGMFNIVHTGLVM